jgi:hypothetical protein
MMAPRYPVETTDARSNPRTARRHLVIHVQFPTRILNALTAAGLRTVGEVREASDEMLLSLPDLGPGSVEHLRQTRWRQALGQKAGLDRPVLPRRSAAGARSRVGAAKYQPQLQRISFNASRAAVSASLDAISKADDAMSRWVTAAGLKLIVVPVDSTWMRHSLASGSRARLPTPAEPERVAPVSASRSGPVPRVGAPERRW